MEESQHILDVKKEEVNEAPKCNRSPKTPKYQSSIPAHKWSTHLIDLYYRCKLCEMRFVTDSSLKRHVLTHFTAKDSEQSICNVCDETINSPEKLEQHLLEHEMKGTHKCEECCAFFETAEILASHRNFVHVQADPPSEQRPKRKDPHLFDHAQHEHENGADFLCDLCGETFTHSERLKEHALWHDDEMIAKCDHCPKRYSTEEQLSAHKEHAHAPVKHFQCEMCHKIFTTHHHLINHKEIEHATFEVFSCPSCLKLSPLPAGLENVIYKCNQCENTCTSMANLFSHKYHVHSQRILQCKDCLKKFVLDVKTASEKPIKTSEFSHRWFKCDACPKTVTSSLLLNSHKKLEHSEFPCKSCGKRVSFPANSGNLTYNCGKCNNTNLSLLKQLMPKPFQCEDYSEEQIEKHPNKKSYTAQTDLPRIKLPVIFKCEVCLKTFSTNQYLTNHRKLAHEGQTPKSDNPTHNQCNDESQATKNKEKPTVKDSNRNSLLESFLKNDFKCDVCHLTFCTDLLLTRHKKVVHATDDGISCRSCGKQFSFPAELGNLTYKCDQCDYVFKTRKSLFSHKHQAHSLECDDCSNNCFVLNLKNNLKKLLSDNKRNRVDTVEEVVVKEEPVEAHELRPNNCFVLNLKANLKKLLDDNERKHVDTFEEVDVKEEPVEAHEREARVKHETEEEVDVKQEPEKVDDA